jgi:AAA+ ATPase superfamily predicted ATPase
MPTINNDDLNKLRGNTFNGNLNGAMSEGKQTIDKVTEIIKGINDILSKAQSFKAQAQQSREASGQSSVIAPVPTQSPQVAPSDMQPIKRAIVFIDEDKIIPMIKEFISSPFVENNKEKTVSDLVKELDGKEGIIKTLIVQIIKQNTQIKYID